MTSKIVVCKGNDAIREFLMTKFLLLFLVGGYEHNQRQTKPWHIGHTCLLSSDALPHPGRSDHSLPTCCSVNISTSASCCLPSRNWFDSAQIFSLPLLPFKDLIRLRILGDFLIGCHVPLTLIPLVIYILRAYSISSNFSLTFFFFNCLVIVLNVANSFKRL